MKILAFDSSGSACSAAVAVGDSLMVRRSEKMERGQAERLMPMIREALNEARVAPRELDLVAVTIGPGTFTGIRIALAAARGFALASGVPVLGVTGFDAIAAAVPTAERAGRALLVALDSRRGDAFVQLFAGRTGIGPEPVAFGHLSEWLPDGPVLIAGDAAAEAAAALERAGREAAIAAGPGTLDATAVLALARARWRPGEQPPAPRPLYLRAASVTLTPPR